MCLGCLAERCGHIADVHATGRLHKECVMPKGSSLGVLRKAGTGGGEILKMGLFGRR